jgi:prolyl 3-hydroxylase /prolyl 3,4-dihydroxylase
MAPDDEDDDPAVYRSGTTKNKGKEPQHSTSSSSKNPSPSSSSKPNGVTNAMDKEHGNDNEELPAGSEEEEEEEESMLLATQAGFNKLLLVLRDEQVMRFVKYVSAAAPGSRWDICGEYEVGMVTDDSENEG